MIHSSITRDLINEGVDIITGKKEIYVFNSLRNMIIDMWLEGSCTEKHLTQIIQEAFKKWN
jgi:hypothetical protein